MRILSIKTFNGPSVFHHQPVLCMTLDLEELTEKASTDCDGFTELLLSTMPTLYEHHCSPRHRGGFVERLNRGTYFAHIIEHITLELSELSGIGVNYGKSIYAGPEGTYQVAVRFKSEEGMRFLLESAVELARALVKGESFSVEDCVREAKEIIRKHALGPSTEAILNAAIERNIPWQKIDGLGLIQLGWGKHRKLFQATTTSSTSDLGVQMARDKDFTKILLRDASVPIPEGRVVYSLEEAIEVMNAFGGGVVVKPVDGNHGRGVTLNVSTIEEMQEAYKIAEEESSKVLIEECFKGKDYRAVMVDGKLIAASERVPAHVMGNGHSTVRELVAKENENPLRGEGHEKPLTYITFDESAMNFLHRKNIDLQFIPEAGEIVYLRETANLSTGGLSEDVTDDVHPSVRSLCERVARVSNLDVCGLDLVLTDISMPLAGQKGGVIEVNAGPGIRMHHYPSKGKSRDVGGAIVESLFKVKSDGRIPIVAITGTNGKTTVTRLLDHVIGCQGLCVGTTTTDGIFIDGELVSAGDMTGPISARTVLSDPGVDVAVLETARGGIVRRGLGYDWSDVGIITNIHADHIGQDGIESIDDILHIKSLVVERVRKGGTIILNADVPELVQLARTKLDLSDRKLVYFSINEYSPVIFQHVKEGGEAYILKQDELVHLSSRGEEVIIHSQDIPLTFGGTASFHIANALSVIAAADALKVPRNILHEGLVTFVHHEKNKGRTNLYKIGRGHILLDYAHNPDALISIGGMTKKWKVSKRTGVITTPGDRSDDMIRMSGIAAALVFDKVIVREDEDSRGRKRGEIADLLCEAISTEKANYECVRAIDPIEALKLSVEQMVPGELVMYFYESFGEIEKILKEMGATTTDVKSLLRGGHREYSSNFEEWRNLYTRESGENGHPLSHGQSH
jgi:cyanophycin synthetase